MGTKKHDFLKIEDIDIENYVYRNMDGIAYYPIRELWQLTKNKLEFLKESFDAITFNRIQFLIFSIVEKIVEPNLDEYIFGELEVPLEKIYSDKEYVSKRKRIYKSDNIKVPKLDDKKIKDLLQKILLLPTILFYNIEDKDNELIITKSENETLKRFTEDKGEAEKKKIENMAQSYITTCNSFKTFKPDNAMLSKISGVEEIFWKRQRRNELFLKYLLEELIKQFNQAKKKKDFWQKVINYVNTKIDFISDPDKFKLKYGFNENKDYENRIAKSKGEKIKAQEEMIEKEPVKNWEELKCGICGELIDSGKWCNECLEEFK